MKADGCCRGFVVVFCEGPMLERCAVGLWAKGGYGHSVKVVIEQWCSEAAV